MDVYSINNVVLNNYCYFILVFIFNLLMYHYI